MVDLFKEILPSILQKDKNVLETEKDYVPFVINKALSYHKDCIFWANEMNQRPTTDKRMQYDFLRKSIRKTYRPYQPWIKKDNSEYLACVMEHFKMSEAKAIETINILTKEQLEQIQAATCKGGNIGQWDTSLKT